MKRRSALFLIVGVAWLLGAACSIAQDAERLVVGPETMSRLRELRREEKFAGNRIMTPKEKVSMARTINSMLDRLVAGLEEHPTRDWVVAQIRPAVADFYLEDTEVREPCVLYVSAVFKILGLSGSKGAFREYMIEF